MFKGKSLHIAVAQHYSRKNCYKMMELVYLLFIKEEEKMVCMIILYFLYWAENHSPQWTACSQDLSSLLIFLNSFCETRKRFRHMQIIMLKLPSAIISHETELFKADMFSLSSHTRHIILGKSKLCLYRLITNMI